MQNGTNCDTNSGNTQHHFVGVRGYGHDKSAPTPTESTWKNTPTNTPKGVFANSLYPYHNQKQLVLMYEIWRICDTNNTNRTSGK